MKTKILFILPSFVGGGAERVVLQLASGIDPHIFSPSIAVFKSSGPLKGIVPDYIPLVDLKRDRLRTVLPSLIVAIRRIKPSIVVSSIGYVNIALLAVRLLMPRGTRIIIREANMPTLSLPHGPQPKLMHWLYRRYYPKADAVICSSNMMLGEMAGYINVHHTRLHRLPNPINQNLLRSLAGSSEQLTRKAGAVQFISCGRLVRQKGFDRLIELFSELPDNMFLTILGDGNEFPELLKKIHHLDLSSRINIRGFVDNPWAEMIKADAFIMSSRWEGMPNSVLESLACGVPVIATPESGAISEISRAAPTGAVQIIPWGEQFHQAILEVEPNQKVGLRKSLLPSDYDLGRVVYQFENVLRMFI